MKWRFVFIQFGALLLAAAARGELTVGDDAPALAQGKYFQGKPVTELEKGKVYVLEMWATWCGPCIDAMPHVAQMQTKYADKGLIVIGQNVWERDEMKVEPFVRQMGAKLTYRIAMDDKSQAREGMMARTWMEAAGQDVIPCSFIVNRDRKIAWIGHPLEMEQVLADVIDGKHDLASAKEQHARHLSWRKKVTELRRLASEEKWAEALAVLDDMQNADAKRAKEFANVRYRALMQLKQFDKAAAVVEEALQSVKEDARSAIVIAEVAYELREHDAALKLATAAAPHGKELSYYSHMLQAFVHAARKNWDKAVEAQNKALELAPDQTKANLRRMLDGYQKKAQEGGAGARNHSRAGASC